MIFTIKKLNQITGLIKFSCWEKKPPVVNDSKIDFYVLLNDSNWFCGWIIFKQMHMGDN